MSGRGTARVVLPPVIQSGCTVDAGVRLRAEHPGIAVTGGRIVNRTAGPVPSRVVVTPVDADGREGGPEAFDVTVLPPDAPVLLAGTRCPDADPDVYAARIAFSLHLALVTPEGAITRLNDDRGVLFPRAVPTAHLDVRRVRTLTDPWVFTVPGGYAVVASPALADGSAEAASASSVLLFRSADLITFEEAPLVALGTGSGVRRPHAVYDGARRQYLLWWTDDDGRAWSSRAATLDGPWAAPRPGAPVVPTVATRDTDPGHLPGCALPVGEADVARLLHRYGRIRNVAVDVPAVHATAGDEPGELPWAHLTYDDGSTARRPVDWDPAALAALGWDTPGEYPLTGTVRQRTYPFPFVVDRADPTVLHYRGRYYFIATNDPGGDCVTTTTLFLRTADSVAALATAEDHPILTAGTAGLAGSFWAPELHEFAGRLHCFVAPSVAVADWSRVQCHVMRLRVDGDPVVAADWEEPRPVLQADGSPLQSDAEHPGISLDMTYVEDRGRSHLIWSQRYITDRIGDAGLWIATVDPADPWRLTSAPVRLVSAEYGWDHDVAEGPFLLRHGDLLVVTYSGSAVGPTYAVGAVEARSGSDLLDPASWTKAPAPVLGTRTGFGHWGSGHNTFSRDEDGLELVVFHAHPTLTERGRCAALRRIHWAADGHLVLDQLPDEEVAPHLRTVRTVLRVEPREG